jgi:hypothetical protein
MRYVTYYYSVISGLADVVFHEDKETAINFYRKNAKRYFDVRLPRKTNVPTACGFFHRRLGLMSIRMFNSRFPEWKRATNEDRR